MLVLHFQRKPIDLYVAAAYTIVIGVALLVLGNGNEFAIPIALFFPGYVAGAALFPADKIMGWLERLGLSIGLDFAIVPILGYVLNLTPWGVGFVPVVLSVVLFTLSACVLAYQRRIRLAVPDRLSATLRLSVPRLGEYSRAEQALVIILAASVVLGAGALALILTLPVQSSRSTEFSVLGMGGNRSSYPSHLNVSQPYVVTLAIKNYEGESVAYRLRIDRIGAIAQQNKTTGFNETVEVNRTTWSWFNVTLANGGNWTELYTFAINITGLWKVQFLLFRDVDYGSAYRELHFYVEVE